MAALPLNIVEYAPPPTPSPSLFSRIDRLEQCVNVLCVAVRFFAQKEVATAEKAVKTATPQNRTDAEANLDEMAAMLKSLLEIAELTQKQVRTIAEERRTTRDVLEAKIADLTSQLMRL